MACFGVAKAIGRCLLACLQLVVALGSHTSACVLLSQEMAINHTEQKWGI